MKKSLLAAALTVLLLSGCRSQSTASPQAAGTPILMIAHGLGGIDGRAYTNSWEALGEHIKNGTRVFETDIHLSNEGIPILHHRNSGSVLNGSNFTLQQFASERIFDSYTPLTLEELLRYGEQIKDLQLIIDVKAPDARPIYHVIAHMVNAIDPLLMQRIIPETYSKYDVKTVKKLGFHNTILALYRNDLPDDKVLRTCKKFRNIVGVSMTKDRFSPTFARKLEKHRVLALVHTINDPQQLLQYEQMGADGFFTDFLLPHP